MILQPEHKTLEIFRHLRAISDLVFDLTERPAESILQAHFETDDVFIDRPNKPWGFAMVTDRQGPYIWTIAVEPMVQKIGLGSKLLKEIAAYYQTVESIRLTCKIANWEAQRLYLKHGYRVIRVMPKYYGKEDGLLMGRIHE